MSLFYFILSVIVGVEQVTYKYIKCVVGKICHLWAKMLMYYQHSIMYGVAFSGFPMRVPWFYNK